MPEDYRIIETLQIEFCQLPWSPRSIANVAYVTRSNMTLKELISQLVNNDRDNDY